MKLHRVALSEADHGGLGDVHTRRRPRPDVFHELLDVLGGDGRRGFELQQDRVIDLHVQSTDQNGYASGHGEHIHLRQTRDPPVIQLGRQHAVVEPLGRPGFVPLDDGHAGPLDRLHQRGVVGGDRGLQKAGPRHEEEEEGYGVRYMVHEGWFFLPGGGKRKNGINTVLFFL